ncbi:hypothetical protein RFI_08236 [Reticulomyxa filosa]|uniref:Uncharacterized protein n=1 Tax=Reticulomyxa filosa TaxID=46433 RepID=X6NSE4_RETFI|nr:hypothetical protein RFI_08236 [Reticulomyxa filosa]|eukprot:ETO28891.1 hypothetical protein RFI_08236 [Reticulomyxa filosa]
MVVSADNKEISPYLRWLTLGYHAASFVLIFDEFTHHTWGEAQWTTRYGWYCHLMYFLFGLNVLVVYGINILFWLYRLGTSLLPKKYVRIYIHFFSLCYDVYVMNFFLFLTFGNKQTKKQLCSKTHHFKYQITSDFDVKFLFANAKNDNNFYFCHREAIAGAVLTVTGTILACGLNGVIAYMYVSRILATVRLVQQNVNLDHQHLSAVEKGQQRRTEVAVEAKPLLEHACKSGIIAFTSILSTIISFTLASTVGYEQFLAIDTIFNGILICCSFTFGHKVFDCLLLVIKKKKEQFEMIFYCCCYEY